MLYNYTGSVAYDRLPFFKHVIKVV